MDLLAAIAEQDERVRVYRNERNLGLHGNLVHLLHLAQGRYIKILMADDLLFPDALARLRAPLDEHPSVVLSTSRRLRIDGNGDRLPDTAHLQPPVTVTGIIDGRELGNTLLERQVNLVGEPSTAMFRRADVNPDDMFVFRGTRYGTLVDMVLWIQLLSRGACHYITEPLSCYRQHDGQLGVASGSQIADRLEWMQLLLDAPLLGFLQDPDQEARALHHRIMDTMAQGVSDPTAGQQLLLQQVTRIIDRLTELHRQRRPLAGVEAEQARVRIAGSPEAIADQVALTRQNGHIPLPRPAEPSPVVAASPSESPTGDTEGPEEVQAALAANDRTLEDLTDRAEDAFDSGQDEACARWIQAAADWGWFNHPGRFTSARLEELALRLAERVGAEWHPVVSATPPRTDGKRRVLHVLTEAYDVGGHTRLAWRWMAADNSSVHSVALTAQGSLPVPAQLVASAEAAGGSFVRIDETAITAAARRLAELAAEADLVVLHSHPFDVVPTLALGRPHSARVPVALLNHADHVFWLGTGVTDVVANVRPSGEQVTVSRRGVPANRCVALPSPIPVPETTGADADLRAAARAELGLPTERPVLLAVAPAYKFAPVDRPGFLDLIPQVLAQHPQALLVAVGPSPDDPGWREAAEASGGRLLVKGRQVDLVPYYRAADGYLDSFPFTSPTAFLEAALYGVPVLGYRPDADLGPLAADDFGAGDLLRIATTPDEWISLAGELIATPEAQRAEEGNQLAAVVAAAHSGEGWQSYADEVYAATVRARDVGTVQQLADQRVEAGEIGALDRSVWLLHLRGGETRHLPDLIRRHGAETADSRPPLSIVLSLSQGGRQSEFALRSVRTQALPGCEILLLDRGVAEPDPRLDALGPHRVVRTATDDPEQAWEEALNATSGRVVLFMSDDLQLAPYSLQSLVDQVVAEPSTLASPLLVGDRGTGVSADFSGHEAVCLVAQRRALLGEDPLDLIPVRSARASTH
jgi:hypothetical protein